MMLADNIELEFNSPKYRIKIRAGSILISSQFDSCVLLPVESLKHFKALAETFEALTEGAVE